MMTPLPRLAFVLGVLLAVPVAGAAQTPADDEPLGPTREALMSTALRMSAPPAPSADVLLRYDSFANDFRSHFGQSVESPDDFMNGMHQTLLLRFGDTPVYQWVQRGLVLYARMKALTEMERNGFEMEVEMDDVAEGKLGVRVNRSLE